MAERKAPRTGRGDEGSVDIQGRVDERFQRSLRSAAEHHVGGALRGDVGRWFPGRLRLRDVRGWRSVAVTKRRKREGGEEKKEEKAKEKWKFAVDD